MNDIAIIAYSMIRQQLIVVLKHMGLYIFRKIRKFVETS